MLLNFLCAEKKKESGEGLVTFLGKPVRRDSCAGTPLVLGGGSQAPQLLGTV